MQHSVSWRLPLMVSRSGIAALIGLSVLGSSTTPSISLAQAGSPMTAAQSDPRTLGWMIGAPPTADKVIRFTDSDYFTARMRRCHSSKEWTRAWTP